jgi:hypothetical protein
MDIAGNNRSNTNHNAKYYKETAHDPFQPQNTEI